MKWAQLPPIEDPSDTMPPTASMTCFGYDENIVTFGGETAEGLTNCVYTFDT